MLIFEFCKSGFESTFSLKVLEPFGSVWESFESVLGVEKLNVLLFKIGGFPNETTTAAPAPVLGQFGTLFRKKSFKGGSGLNHFPYEKSHILAF